MQAVAATQDEHHHVKITWNNLPTIASDDLISTLRYLAKKLFITCRLNENYLKTLRSVLCFASLSHDNSEFSVMPCIMMIDFLFCVSDFLQLQSDGGPSRERRYPLCHDRVFGEFGSLLHDMA